MASRNRPRVRFSAIRAIDRISELSVHYSRTIWEPGEEVPSGLFGSTREEFQSMKLRTFATLLILATLALGASETRADDTIFDIQLGIATGPVNVDDVVVTGVARFGFFVQEPDPDPTWGRMWSGVWVYTNGANGDLQKGDRVNIINGDLEEFFDFTEINLVSSGGSFVKTFDGTPANVPAPVNVNISAVNDTGINAEAYESVLIRVDASDPTLFTYAPNGFGEWYIRTNSNGTGDSLLVDQYSGQADGDFIYDVPPAGTQLTYAQGILVFNFSQYKLAPRDCETDLVGPSGVCRPVLKGAYSTSATKTRVEFGVALDPVVMGNPSNYEFASGTNITGAQIVPGNPKIVELTSDPLGAGDSENVTAFVSKAGSGLIGTPNQDANFRSGITPIALIQQVANPAVNDASPLANEVVTVQGKVTAVEGNFYYLQDGDGGQWDGLYVRVARTGPLAVGDLVQASGLVNEFFTATQVSFQPGVNNYQNLGPAGAPVVNTVTAAQIRYSNITTKVAEPWEYNLVRVAGATVDSVGNGAPSFGEWQLLQGAPADTAGFDLFEITTGVSYDPCVGDIVNFTGILRFEFDQYRIAPRNGRGGDIIVTFDNPACETTSVPEGASATRLSLRNAPNPFADVTRISLQLPHAAEVKIEVIDVAGRLVRTLANTNFAAGEVSVIWDGRSDANQVVPSGTYFYTVVVDGERMGQRLVKLGQ